MAQSDNLAKIIYALEGGFQNDPVDKGNYLDGVLIGTNRGVTPSAYLKAFGKKPTEKDICNLTYDQYHHVLISLYWNRWRANDINSEKVANILVDWVYNSGKWGIIIPQRILEINPDGIVGTVTTNAVNSVNANVFHGQIYKAREDFFQDIVDKSVAAYEARIGRDATLKEKLKYTKYKFHQGWMNRLAHFQ